MQRASSEKNVSVIVKYFFIDHKAYIFIDYWFLLILVIQFMRNNNIYKDYIKLQFLLYILNCQILILFSNDFDIKKIHKGLPSIWIVKSFEFMGHLLKATILKQVGLICVNAIARGRAFVAAIRSRHYLSKPRFGSLKPKGDLASSTS